MSEVNLPCKVAHRGKFCKRFVNFRESGFIRMACRFTAQQLGYIGKKMRYNNKIKTVFLALCLTLLPLMSISVPGNLVVSEAHAAVVS